MNRQLRKLEATPSSTHKQKDTDKTVTAEKERGWWETPRKEVAKSLNHHFILVKNLDDGTSYWDISREDAIKSNN